MGSTAKASVSQKYRKIESNVFQLIPQPKKRRVLTVLGERVLIGIAFFACFFVLLYYILR